MIFERFARPLMILLTLLLVTACSEPIPDEVRIRQRIEAMAQATVDKDLDAAIEPVHEDFLGNSYMRKINLKSMLRVSFYRYEKLHAIVQGIEVSVNGEEAEVKCNVVLAGGQEFIPERGKVLRVKSKWQKIEGDWFVVSASWRDPLLR